ncbi:MAG: zinc-dependent metalloprotease [Bacteroidetes bacterium]|nr:zinc-dependent metalloprotease [Bacteroidota bacterium]
MKKALVLLFLFANITVHAQGLISESLNQSHQHEHNGNAINSPLCGSHLLMKHQDQKSPGFIDASNAALKKVIYQIERQAKSSKATLSVPVVFHVVYNNSDENLPDSVIFNQLQALNDNFSRQNADTASLRSVFEPYVGNPQIEFVLASQSPDGSPTNGITRTNTNVEHFGGILPYAGNQTAQIQQWVNDSLFYNFFRITEDSLGGISAWDTERYLNIWIGDLRIFEPMINNFEELVLLGLAPPPPSHPSFTGLGFDTLALQQGVLMHYVAIGPNNPISYPAPYTALNNTVSKGDLLSHEVGHYLGLRHIWGDGACLADDFIFDTPLSDNSNQFTGNKNRNSCVDSIDGQDLPDMVENFMDYSSDDCLNSFTADQASVMRATLFTYRPNAFTIGAEEIPLTTSLKLYPNPSKGIVYLNPSGPSQEYRVSVYQVSGKLMSSHYFAKGESLSLSLPETKGLYLIKVYSQDDWATFKVLRD